MRLTPRLILSLAFMPAYLVGTVILPAGPAAADDSDQIYEAVQGLKESNVFLFESDTLMKETALRDALEDTSIGVVVIPGDASMDSYDEIAKEASKDKTTEYESFAEAVYEQAEKEGFRTIVVLSENKSEVATNGGLAEMEGDLSDVSAQSPGGIILNVEDWEDINQTTFNEWGPFVLVPAGIIAVIMLLFFLGWLWEKVADATDGARYRLRRRRAAKKQEAEAKAVAARQEAAEKERARQEAIVQNLSKDIPKDLRARLDKLQNWAATHVAPKDKVFAQEIRVVIERFQILFERIEERGTDQQKRIAMVEYRDLVEKLSTALSERYYLDILANPELWDEPEARIEQVKKAVAGTKHQLLENIKQINASRDLEFQVALEALAGFMDRPKVEDLYRDVTEEKA